MAEKKTQALSLLQGILEETHSEAEAEKERLAAELKNREEAERRAAEEAERRRRADSERRLAEEDARQRAAAERRAAELERIRIDDLKARGLWQEPKVPEPVEAAPTTAPVGRPAMSTQDAMALQALAARKARRGPMLAAAIVLVAAAGGGGGWWYVQNIEHVDATTTYAKAEVRTAERELASASIGFNQIPDPVVLAAPTPEPAAATSRPRPRGSGSSSSSASSSSRPPRIQLGGSLGRE